MTATNSQLEAVFHAAYELKDLEQREVYLKSVGAKDPELRNRVEHLIHAADQANAALGAETTPDDLAPSPDTTEIIGSTIGNYRILQQIGEGGMGAVYMAEQTQPVRRKVALKIIKLGMDTKQVVARFEAERQALALMDHPNIAKVLDAGATDSGRPYFVMELVKGVPITEFCDKNKLNAKERIEIFLKVCHAIQSAHQKGVIHRDIKPSNILVSLTEGAPHPMIIDFGIAKATNQRLTEKTLFTNYAQMVGTPAYMSPEQAEMSQLDVDTRSDIYSLGVLLYELLTGEPPFTTNDLCSQGYGEMQRIIAEEEPPRPSLRLSSLEEKTQTVVAKNRSISLPNLRKQLQGDLDWIILKALEKNRSRRYETATGLANDLKRHLENEPVTAAKPSLAYQFGKFYRRKRPVAISALAIAAALIATTTISWVQNAETQRANRRVEEEKERAEEATRLTEKELSKAIINEADFAQASRQPGYRMHSLKLLQRAIQLDPKYDNKRCLSIALRALEDPYYGTATQQDTIPVDHADDDTISVFRMINNYVAIGYIDGVVRIYDFDTLKKHLELRPQTATPIYSIAYLSDTDTWVTADAEGKILAWDSEAIGQDNSGPRRISHPESEQRVFLASNANTLVIGNSGAKTLTVWKPKTNPVLVTIPEALDTARDSHEQDPSEYLLSISNDSRLVAYSHRRTGQSPVTAVIVGDLESGDLVKRLPIDHYPRTPIQTGFSEDNQLLFAVGNQEISIFETQNWTRYQHTKNGVSFGTTYSIAEGAPVIVYGSELVKTVMWNYEENVVERIAPIHTAFPRYDPVDGSVTGRVRINGAGWARVSEDRGDNSVVTRLYSRDSNRYGLVYSPDDRWIASTGSDGLRVWDTKTKIEALIERPYPEWPNAENPTFSHDGGLLAAGFRGDLAVWETTSWKLVFKDTYSTRQAFHPSKDYLLVGGYRDSEVSTNGITVLSYNLHDGTLNTEAYAELKSDENTAWLGWDDSGTRFAWTSSSKGWNGPLHVSDLTPNNIHPYVSNDYAFIYSSFAFNANQDEILRRIEAFDQYSSKPGEHSIQQWDYRSNRIIKSTVVEDLKGLDYTPNHDFVITIHGDRIALRSKETLEEVIGLPNSTSNGINRVALSNSGSYVAYALDDGEIRIWDLEATRKIIEDIGLEWPLK